jgi:hypothetical protein
VSNDARRKAAPPVDFADLAAEVESGDDPVDVYRRYAGRVIRSEKDSHGRLVTITPHSFARHLGIDKHEFEAAVRLASSSRRYAVVVVLPRETPRPEAVTAYLRNRERSTRSIRETVNARMELRKLEDARLAMFRAKGMITKAARAVTAYRTCAADDCKNTFEPEPGSDRKYCSSKCRYRVPERHYRCQLCGVEFISKASYASYCSVKCRNRAGHRSARKRQLADAV